MLPPLTAWKRTLLELESLEAREVPAITIQLDYSLDLRSHGGSGFFESNPGAKAVMNRVAQEMGQRIDANLSAIVPSGGNTWTAAIFNPETGGQFTVRNLRIAADTIVVYVGARAMPGSEAGVGGFGGFSWTGAQAWGNTVGERGWRGFSLWGGSIAFDTTTNWHTGLTTDGLDSNEVDFYSVATHELGHILGIGTAPEWFAQVRGGSFIGPATTAVSGGAVPVSSEGAHWADGVTSHGQPVSMDPMLNYGTRVTWTSLDQAALRDIGWGNGTTVSPPIAPPAPPTVPPPPPPSPPTAQLPRVGTADRLPVLVSSNGTVLVYARGADGNLASTGQAYTPFTGFNGAVRTAVADFSGDGIADYAFATGRGTAAKMRVIDGATGADLLGPTQVLGGFGGGAFVAAGDVNRDGRADLVVSADAGGLPTVEVYQVAAGHLSPVTSFMPFSPNLRSGVRVAMGDVNRDGVADLIVGVGPGALPRVVIFDGASLTGEQPTRMNPAFLAFGRQMKDGVNLGMGDVDGDGFDDLIVSQDGGGNTKVRVWSGSIVAAAPTAPLSQLPTYQQFFANGTRDRNGIRVVARDLDGDGKAEVVTSAASGDRGWLRVLSVTASGVDALAAVFPFDSSQAVTAGLSVPDADDFALPGGPCLCCQPDPQTPNCRRLSG